MAFRNTDRLRGFKEITSSARGGERPISRGCTDGYCDGLRENMAGYLGRFEGWLTRVKNLHWASKHNSAHERIGEFYDLMQKFSDVAAEVTMGLDGDFAPDAIVSVNCPTTDIFDLHEEIFEGTIEMYEKLGDDPVLCGLRSEFENFVSALCSKRYLFGRCDVAVR